MFNLKDNLFCELFPDVCEKINELTNKAKVENISTKNDGSVGANGSDEPNNNNNNEAFKQSFTNIFFLIGLVVFGVVVNYIFNNASL